MSGGRCEYGASSCRGLIPGPPLAARSAPLPTPSRGQEAHTDRGIRTPASSPPGSAQPAAVQPLHQPQERPGPPVPRQEQKRDRSKNGTEQKRDRSKNGHDEFSRGQPSFAGPRPAPRRPP